MTDHDPQHTEHFRPEEHIACLKCNYDLTGMDPSGSCPECGTRITETCIVCEYDLSATDPRANCPECGTPVYCSSGRGALGAVPTEQLRSLHTGFRLITNLILLYIISMVLTIVALYYVIANMPDDYYPFSVIAAIANNGLVFGVIYGWFRITPRLQNLPEPIDAPDKRSFVRITLWIFAAITSISLIYALIPTDPNAPPSAIDIAYGIFSFLSAIFMLVVFVSNVMYMGWFARLVRNRKMAKRAKHFVWYGPLITVVGFFILFLGPLITLILYWNMIEYIRRDLKKIIAARAEQ
jgi:DNA-directed RNA polymerase subunit RPC12/RpoP